MNEPSKESMERARELVPYSPTRRLDIYAVATALDAAEQRGAERERSSNAAWIGELVTALLIEAGYQGEITVENSGVIKKKVSRALKLKVIAE